ncbi:MAG: SDR family oxidoreductase [Ignavibacteriae bacterium]|nr:SDR family oxidoreductase [Ignavibacteriota bacterium]
MKILITGGSGLLGQYLNIFLSKENEILTLYRNNPGNCINYNSLCQDITGFKGMSELFSSFRPDAVVHCAGFTRPEACSEENKEEVIFTNVEATKHISELCDKHNAKLIYTSTDLVYDGDSGGMMKENGKLKPLSMYAETKLETEKEIQNTFRNYVILRTSLLIGFGLNHSKTNFHIMYDALKEGSSPKLFSDQFRTPFSLLNAAEVISELAVSDVKEIILNFSGRDRLSRVELGELVCDLAGFDKNLIEKIKMTDVPGFPAVKDVSLDTSLIQSFGFKIKSAEEAIFEILKTKGYWK